MFKKIISQLSFSPVTVERLGEYAKTVRIRQRLYGWSILLSALLLAVQIFTIVAPASHSSSSTSNDLIAGGAPSLATVLSAYDNNSNNFKDVADLLSISRTNLEAAALSENCNLRSTTIYTTGKTAYLDEKQEKLYQVAEKPLYVRSAVSTIPTGWCGTTDQNTTFLINRADGNILTPSEPVVQPSNLTRSITVDAREVSPGQTVTWSLTLTNNTSSTVSEDVWFSTGDISEYAHITAVSDDGIVTDADSHILWPSLSVNPNERKTLTVTAYVDHTIDTTAQQPHNIYAYDCHLTASFGNTTETVVACPITKQIEAAFQQSYTLSNTASIVIYASLLAISTIAYFSLRLRSRELRIIRKQLNTGGL
mgnify:CR=1 FL=1